MMGIGLPELIVIFLVFVLLFGAKSLPEIAKGLGKAIKMVRHEMQGFKEDIDLSQTYPHGTTQQKKSENDFDPTTPRRDWRPTSSSPDVNEKNNNDAA